ARLGVDRSVAWRAWSLINLSTEWKVYTHTLEMAAGKKPGVSIGKNDPNTPAIYIAGCWLVKSSEPGRPVWGSEGPVTCARDRHTISTEGWPTTSGVMRFVVTLLGDAPDI